VSTLTLCRYLFGALEGWQGGGANREVHSTCKSCYDMLQLVAAACVIFLCMVQVASPIEGLPDVEESHCISAQQLDMRFEECFRKIRGYLMLFV